MEKENSVNTYRILAVGIVIAWLVISVIAVANPSVFRDKSLGDKTGYYRYDDRILYYRDQQWYEFDNYQWIETSDDIETDKEIWNYKISFPDIRSDHPGIHEISVARIWMEKT